MELSNEATKARNAYQKKWRQKNSEKIKQYNVNYWEKKANEVSVEIKIMELHKKGMSIRQIEAEIGMSKSTVHRIIKNGTQGTGF